MRIGPAPGFAKYPQHRMHIRPFAGRVTVSVAGRTLADSRNALLLDETGYERRYYLPTNDVRLDELTATDSCTYCPFKGQARYWGLESEGVLEDIAWGYPETYDQAAALIDHIAFYADRVEFDVVPESPT